jgi:hypothetical protein
MIEGAATTSALLALAGLVLLVMIIGRRVIRPAPAAPITPGAALAPSFAGAVPSPWEY